MSEHSASGDFQYVGNELSIFQFASNWKRYVARRVRRYVNGDVLEVGAGLGANVPYLFRGKLTRFVSLEPDKELCSQYRQRQSEGLIPSQCEIIEGTLESLPPEETFNSILYFDVIEHIEEDREEVSRAFERLRPGGHLIILCPAHNWLYSPFDKSIGHYRRYNKQMYRQLSERKPVRLEYLDSVGLLASAANKLVLRQSIPSKSQIMLWDRLFVRMSRILDPITFHLIGKSILGVWRRDE